LTGDLRRKMPGLNSNDFTPHFNLDGLLAQVG
jgi:hypothetical protein